MRGELACEIPFQEAWCLMNDGGGFYNPLLISVYSRLFAVTCFLQIHYFFLNSGDRLDQSDEHATGGDVREP